MKNNYKILMKNIGNLFSKSKAKKAKAFFAHEVFNRKSRKIIVREMIDQNGRSFVRMGMKSSPYLMHFASTILALGGLTLTVGSFIKNNITQRIGFARYQQNRCNGSYGSL